jgi:multiple sugar transport system substrate-binding protein/putative aldouronate transport system substrate-binding protein
MGADTTMEYLKKNHMLLVEEGTSYIAPVETLEQTTIRRQCKNAIQHYSWLMIFAADKAEFDALLQQMQQTVESYGYPTVLEYDLTHAKAKSSGKAVNVDIFKKY